MSNCDYYEELQHMKEAIHEIEQTTSMLDLCHSNTIADLLVNQHLKSARKLVDTYGLDESLNKIIADLYVLIRN